MKITINELRKIIREEVKKVSDYKKQGWPDCDRPGCTGKMKPSPQTGNKTSLYCTKCGHEKKKAIKLEQIEKIVPTTFECRTCGKYVSGKSDGTFDEPGWKRLAGIDGPNAICPECAADPHSLDSYREEYPNVRIVETKSRRQQGPDQDFSDYIRSVDRDMPTPGSSPDPQDVHDEFLMWRDPAGEVPLDLLAYELGVKPEDIDWNGTGLRVINGVVTEML